MLLNPARNQTSGGLDLWSTILASVLADPGNAVAVLGVFAAEGLAIASRQRMLATLRGWCGWLAWRGYIDSDPTAADEVRLRGTNVTWTVRRSPATTSRRSSRPPVRPPVRWNGRRGQHVT